MSSQSHKTNYSAAKSGFNVERNTWIAIILILSIICGYFMYLKLKDQSL
jgi:hypothetical protein